MMYIQYIRYAQNKQKVRVEEKREYHGREKNNRSKGFVSSPN